MSRWSGLLFATAVTVLACTPLIASAQKTEKVKVSIAATQANYITYIAAIEKGYLREEGFEIEIVQAGGGVATPAQLSGDIEFNTSGSSAISAILKGAPLKVVYFPWERLPYQLWSTTPEIKSLAVTCR